MASNMNEDLRSIKTNKALYAAMYSLLKNFTFKKLTIKEICEEALVSRAAFYTHFIDKYDLLKYWIIDFWPDEFSSAKSYEQIEEIVSSRVDENMVIFKNLLNDADNETFYILFDFLLSTINLNLKKNKGEIYSKKIVLSNFYAGGIISYLLWQINNRFPSEVPLMNRYLYEMLQKLQNWNLREKAGGQFEE